LVNAHQGVIYQMHGEEEHKGLKLLATYADDGMNGHAQTLRVGEGLIGQCALDRRRMLIATPAEATPISSALLKVPPRNLFVLPVLFARDVHAESEFASVPEFPA